MNNHQSKKTIFECTETERKFLDRIREISDLKYTFDELEQKTNTSLSVGTYSHLDCEDFENIIDLGKLLEK